METVQMTVTLSQETANLLLMMSARTRTSVAELLEKAANNYVLHHLTETGSAIEQKSQEETPAAQIIKKAEPEQETKIDRIPLADLGLSVRAYNRLSFYFDSEEEVLAYEGDPLRGLRNLGARSAHEIALAFKEHGYRVEGTVWEKYLSYEVNSAQKPSEPVYLADEEEFVKLHLRGRETNILRINFRNIDDVLALKEDPLAIRRLGEAAAQRIAYALQESGYTVHGTVWEKFLTD